MNERVNEWTNKQIKSIINNKSSTILLHHTNIKYKQMYIYIYCSSISFLFSFFRFEI